MKKPPGLTPRRLGHPAGAGKGLAMRPLVDQSRSVDQERPDHQRLSADHRREQSRAFEHTHGVFPCVDAQGNG
jgi:hypothetical protein